MSNEESKQKILRIGLIQNGKIVEERLIRSRDDVLVGQDFNKNDLVVPVSDLPESFPVFEIKGDRYVLNFNDSMNGRISAGGEVKSVEEFRRSGKAKKTDKGYAIPLSPSSRGRIQIGDVTLLFQFVTPPPERPQPVLPASMRGGWIKSLDPMLVLVLGMSALLQIGFVVWVESQEWPMPEDVKQSTLDRFVDLDEEDLKKDNEEEPEPEETKGEAEPKEKEAEPEEPSEPEEEPEEEEMSPEEEAKKEAERQRQMAEEVKNKTIVGELGHLSKDDGSVADVLAKGAGKKSMEDAFEGSEGVTSGSGAEKSGIKTSGSSDAEGSGEAAGIGDLGKAEGARKAQKGVETGEKKEEQVQASVDLKQPADQGGRGSLDSSSIRDVIQRYQGRIQRCYERQLKKDSSAGGKVVVSFEIGRAGRVTSASSATDTVGGGVGSCVANVISGLRFPRPDGGSVMVNKSFVFEAG